MKIVVVTETCNTAAAKIRNGRRMRPPAGRGLTSVGKSGFISGNASGRLAGKRGILAGAVLMWRHYSLRTSR
jgi:hypothetical protein